jgi:signal transduction histidine kinase/ActR/RegA family two-component response regulator
MKVNKDLIMPASSPDADEMVINPINLSFSGDLESLFLNDYYQNSLKLVRLSLLAGILIYAFFGILDAHLIPDMKGKLWFIRFAIVCPFLFGVIVFSYFSEFKKYFQLSVAAAMTVAGTAIIAMILIIPPPTNYSYYVGVILVFIWGYTFTRVRFLWATISGWVIVAFYEFVGIWIIDTPYTILMSNNFFFISANVAGMIACYSIEYYARRDFYLAYLLKNEQKNIKSANVILEKIVEERTSQLTATNRNLMQEIEERARAEQQRVELENKLQQVQKLEAMGTLAGGIAHDFNNLLMGIQGYTSLILLDTNSGYPHYEKLRSIEQYVLRGAELTRQLLGFARGGRYEVKPANLNEIAQKSSQMFGRTQKEITIHTDFQEGIWTVEVDQGQLEQVLLNLYVNASQAMPGGGHIYIETGNVTLGYIDVKPYQNKPGKYVKLAVRDTGLGMDEKTKERIFDPFFTTKEMGRGTGLGLASAYGIIKSHGGIISAHSKKGEGSTFNIYLPASDKKIEQEKSVSDAMFVGQGRVLLVDDEEMIIKVADGMLHRLGYEVTVARSGKEAVEILQANKDDIDVVILDMIMPDMGGSETFNALKVIRPDIKVILSSGYSIAGEASKILDRGCDAFIQKPFNIKQISRKIREVMDNHILNS